MFNPKNLLNLQKLIKKKNQIVAQHSNFKYKQYCKPSFIRGDFLEINWIETTNFRDQALFRPML